MTDTLLPRTDDTARVDGQTGSGVDEPQVPERELIVSAHAVDRFRQRVTPMTYDQAAEAVVALARTAKTRTQPRHWMKDLSDHRPGTTYLYNSRFPDICLIVNGGIVRTVFTRALCRRWRRETPRPEPTGRRSRHFRAHLVRPVQAPSWMLEPAAPAATDPSPETRELLALLTQMRIGAGHAR